MLHLYRVLMQTLLFDNVLGVVGAAKDNYALMIMGLLLSVLLVVTLASYLLIILEITMVRLYRYICYYDCSSSIDNWWINKPRSFKHKRKVRTILQYIKKNPPKIGGFF